MNSNKLSVSSQPLAISVVVPVYRATDTLGELHERLDAVAEQNGFDYELVFVDDASPDDSWEAIRKLAAGDSRVRGIRLGTNAGQHCATLAGLRHASNEVLVTLDDDLQHPPEAIPSLLAALTGDVDLVYGAPEDISALGLRTIAGREAKRVVGHLIGLNGAAEITSFRAVRRQLVDLLPTAVDRALLLDSYFGWYTDNVEIVRVARSRSVGPSRYRPIDFIRILFDATISFGAGRIRPLVVIGSGFVALGSAMTVSRLLRRGPRRGGQGADVAQALVVAGSGLNMAGLAIVAEHSHRVQLRTAGQLPYWVRETTD